jgi:hypothetical protein
MSISRRDCDAGHKAQTLAFPPELQRRTAMNYKRIDWSALSLAAIGVALVIADYVTDLWGWY